MALSHIRFQLFFQNYVIPCNIFSANFEKNVRTYMYQNLFHFFTVPKYKNSHGPQTQNQ